MKKQIKILEILKDMRSLRSEREQAAPQGKAEVFFSLILYFFPRQWLYLAHYVH